MKRNQMYSRSVPARPTVSVAIHKAIASGFGIGYIRRGGGTVASILCCGVWYFLGPGTAQVGSSLFFAPLLVTILITTVGIWSATVVENEWGKDSYRVVIDEVAGMGLSLLFIPIHIKSLLAGLLLFRLFDILKPLGIRKLEKIRGAGVSCWTIYWPGFTLIYLYGVRWRFIFFKPYTSICQRSGQNNRTCSGGRTFFTFFKETLSFVS